MKGLSPLARGNRHAARGSVVSGGPIPARTGQPSDLRQSPGGTWAYPRSHGATEQYGAYAKQREGLSPLARGNREIHASGCNGKGPIPARTGQPAHGRPHPPRDGAYPRSHGATRHKRRGLLCFLGLSPLARGNLPSATPACPMAGPIPARTGQPPTHRWVTCLHRAYPRSHGATDDPQRQVQHLVGLSPLARGNPRPIAVELVARGPIPARTGQPCACWAFLSSDRAYPRSHGATQCPRLRHRAHRGLSPLARGNLSRLRPLCSPSGPIPARTGQPWMSAWASV